MQDQTNEYGENGLWREVWQALEDYVQFCQLAAYTAASVVLIARLELSTRIELRRLG